MSVCRYHLSHPYPCLILAAQVILPTIIIQHFYRSSLLVGITSFPTHDDSSMYCQFVIAGVHVAVILTKIDEICEGVFRDVSLVFCSMTVKACVDNIAEKLGVLPNSVFPVSSISLHYFFYQNGYVFAIMHNEVHPFICVNS